MKANITVADWLEAEASLKVLPPKPKDSITAEEYAAMRKPKISAGRAQWILRSLCAAEKATRQKWGQCYVYTLKKK